jgi:hypothetical protein
MPRQAEPRCVRLTMAKGGPRQSCCRLFPAVLSRSAGIRLQTPTCEAGSNDRPWAVGWPGSRTPRTQNRRRRRPRFFLHPENFPGPAVRFGQRPTSSASPSNSSAVPRSTSDVSRTYRCQRLIRNRVARRSCRVSASMAISIVRIVAGVFAHFWRERAKRKPGAGPGSKQARD